MTQQDAVNAAWLVAFGFGAGYFTRAFLIPFFRLWWLAIKIAWKTAEMMDDEVRKELTDPGPEINESLLKDAANLKLKQ